MPIRTTRGKSITILGALSSEGKFVYIIRDRTNKTSVIDFLNELLKHRDEQKHTIVVTDNHSAHKAKVVRVFAKKNRIELLFLPVYSSPLSSVERVWNLTKNAWKKSISNQNFIETKDNGALHALATIICGEIAS